MIALFAAACTHQVPEHEVLVTSDCNGPVRSARFQFDAMDFETNCTGGFLEGSCETNEGVGRRLSGDLEVHRFTLEGLEEFGPSRYVLTLPKSEDPSGTANDVYGDIWCGWYVDESLEPEEGSRQPCYYAPRACWAEIEVSLD
jgi:hypothetical protein